MKNVFLAAIPAAAILAFVAFSAEGQTPQTQAGTKVAYVSTQRVLNEVASARTELGRVQALQQQKANEIRTKQQAVDATRLQMANATDADTRSRLAKQEAEQRADFERTNQQAQADLQRLQREIQAELQARVRQAMEQLSKEQGFQVVLNADTALVWAAPGLDVTGLLIERMNAADAAKKP
ncbi:MAG: OmpH family outer membrane protein [Vicinamibacterales bacterium]